MIKTKPKEKLDRFETAYSKSQGFLIWDAERDLELLLSTPGIVGFSSAEECETHQIVYVDRLDHLEQIPDYLFGLPVTIYLETRCPSYRDEEVIHELVRETSIEEEKTFMYYVNKFIAAFIDYFS